MSRVASRFLIVTMATLLAAGWLTVMPDLAKADTGTGSISLTTLDVAASENFDTLANATGSTTNTALPLGWYITETGGGARDNEQYAVDTGSSNTGDTYGYGSATATDRALGGLQSGTLIPLYGASFTNNTGATIAALDVAYAGEQWRIGNNLTARDDRLDFQVSTDAADLNVGTYTNVDALDFTNPIKTAVAVGALDGNAAPNRAAVAATIPSLNIPDGATFFIRWTDLNATGADDGMAVDDFSVTPHGPTGLSVNDVSQAESNSGSVGFVFTVSLSAPAPAGGVTFDVATADGTAVSASSEDYTSTTLTDETIAEGQTFKTFSVPVTGDTTFEPDETFFVNITGVTNATASDAQGLGTILNDDAAGCGDPYTAIHTIQGNGLATTIPGNLSTEGIVVGDFEGTAAASGFYIQAADAETDADPLTSEGIFVFTGSTNKASLGERVRVTGFARERFSQTTINGTDSNTSPVTNVLVCSTGNPLPAATDVSLPFANTDYPERYEGMYVNFPQSLVIAEYFNYDRFGDIVLAKPLAGEKRPFTGTAIDAPGAAANARTAANNLSRITLDDVQSAQNPSVLRHPNGNPFSLTNYFRGGDTVTNTVGILGFDFSLYRILPTGPATYAAANPRPTAPEDTGGRLTIAAQNTLNFFLTADYPTGDPLDNKCGPANNVECRGWDSDQASEFSRQRDKLLATLAGLDADVIGLNEIENSTGVDPLGDPTNGIVAGLNASFGPGTYDYINTGTIGTDAIKVGLIYRPAAVTPVGTYKLLTTAVDPRFIDTKSRPVLAQTFEEVATGARFTVAVNHLKSKGSDCNDVGDPDAGDGQGNCSGTRTKAAQALVDWLATDPTGSGDPDFLIIGDLNSYAREDPIAAIKAGPDDSPGTADDYTNLVASYLGTYAYSFTFDGQAGYLDHALSSAHLTGQVSGVAEWHINSDEADVFDYDTTFKPPTQDALYEPFAYRSSDHDGVIVGLNLVGPPATVAINDGDGQSTEVTTNFPIQLDLTVKDSGGNPVPGAQVTFAGPVSGASASIVETGPYVTDADGNLVVTAQANATAGIYQFVATAGTGSATYHLANEAGPPASITIHAGDNQEATVDTDFGVQLDITVLDANNNPVPNQTVFFEGPTTGASASIVESGPFMTDADGNIRVTAHANAIPGGPYNFVASAGEATATFHLTNLPTVTALLSSGATCGTFAAGTASQLSDISYGVRRSRISSLTVSTFSYWVNVTAVAGSNTFTVNQSITSGNFATLFGLTAGSAVYTSSCTKGPKATFTQSSTNAAAGTVTVTFNAPTAGTYYVNVAFRTGSLKGATAPSPSAVNYRFSTTGVPGTTRALDLMPS
jgi:uncharacterized protein